jgi:hypothetical protein
MRVRPDVDVARNSRREHGRTHMIEENEGADHAPLREGQHSSHIETAETASALIDDELNHRFLRVPNT